MSEIATDFVADEGQPSDAATDESADNSSMDDMPEMGLGMFEVAESADDPAPGAEQTDSESSAADSTNTDSNSTTEQLSEFERGRREADRYFQQKNEEFLAERRAFEQERAAAQKQTEQQARSVSEQAIGDAEALRQQAMQTNDPQVQKALMEQAAGIDYVRQMVNQELQQAGVSDLGQLREAVQYLRQQQQTQATEAVTAQAREAIEIFGEDTVKDPHVLKFISRNRAALSETNPATGKNYTLAELVGQASGRTAQEAAALRQQQRNQRTSAKQGAAPRGSTTAPTRAGGGPISRGAAIAEIAKTYG